MTCDINKMVTSRYVLIKRKYERKSDYIDRCVGMQQSATSNKTIRKLVKANNSRKLDNQTEL